jgi:hypothetical protein
MSNYYPRGCTNKKQLHIFWDSSYGGIDETPFKLVSLLINRACARAAEPLSAATIARPTAGAL